MDSRRTENVAPEFPCDSDLEPYVQAGSLTVWQAMAITSCRAAAEARQLLAELQKKMDQPVPQPTQTIDPMPNFRRRSGGSSG